jgi:hypothetical protein
MSTWTKATLAGVFLLSFVGFALAQDELSSSSFVTTRSLYNDCRGENPDFCSGFIAGIAQAMKDIRTVDVHLREDFCPLASRTLQDRAALFIAWAEARETWESSAYESVYMALWFGEPCA